MSETQTLNQPSFMRSEPQPALNPALETAAPVWIAGEDASASVLAGIRSAAFDALRKIGLPNSGTEDFTFIRVGEFLPHLGPPAVAALTRLAGGLPALELIQSLIFPESRDSYVVLVDGMYAPGLSKPGSDFRVTPLSASLGQGSPAQASLGQASVAQALLAAIAEESDAAAALAMLFSQEPLLIEVAPKAAPKKPLQILHYRTDAPFALINAADARPGNRCDALVVIHAGKLSESQILVRHAGTEKTTEAGSMMNIHTVAILDEAASLRVLESGVVADEEHAIHFRKLTARLARNSRLLAVSAHTGSRLTRNSFAVDLLGEGAESEVDGAAVLIGKKQSHNFLRMRHLVPHCASRQHFKSVAADVSRSSVDGTIVVAVDAQGTNAYQLINNLMLSDEARTDSKPQLMIHADDVKCSHGATTGKLDPAQQFYLESRGLSPTQARTLLTVAFIAEILDKVGDSVPGFRSALEHALLDSLKTRLPSDQGGAVAPKK